jgi:hypothetical protein
LAVPGSRRRAPRFMIGARRGQDPSPKVRHAPDRPVASRPDHRLRAPFGGGRTIGRRRRRRPGLQAQRHGGGGQSVGGRGGPAGVARRRHGGDAAVAVQAVLGLVEPQSSGLGGGAFMVFYDAKTGKVTAYDGREKAPQAAGPDLFLGPNGEPLNFVTAVTFRPLDRRAGSRRPCWPRPRRSTASRLEQPVQGRRASGRRRLHGQSAPGWHDQQHPHPPGPGADAVAYFTKPSGQRYQAGDTLKNPAYAVTLRSLATKGPSALAGRARWPNGSSSGCTRAICPPA